MGVTIDFAHVLYADEMPAYAVSLVLLKSRLLGFHLNDAYGKRDDGLMAGSVHLVQTLELLYVLDRIGFSNGSISTPSPCRRPRPGQRVRHRHYRRRRR